MFDKRPFILFLTLVFSASLLVGACKPGPGTFTTRLGGVGSVIDEPQPKKPPKPTATFIGPTKPPKPNTATYIGPAKKPPTLIEMLFPPPFRPTPPRRIRFSKIEYKARLELPTGTIRTITHIEQGPLRPLVPPPHTEQEAPHGAPAPTPPTAVLPPPSAARPEAPHTEQEAPHPPPVFTPPTVTPPPIIHVPHVPSFGH